MMGYRGTDWIFRFSGKKMSIADQRQRYFSKASS